jgi:DNA (cytosine-5)-methyltransferase 1
MGYTIGSLFAGIGGVCKGFEQAGFELSWANEIDKYACMTYRSNFSHQLLEGDIHNIQACNLSYVDVLTAGFPCQAFSIAGERKGFEDKRGNLFFEVMRIAKELRPKVIFLENVKNLLTHNKGETFKVITDTLLKNNYSYVYMVLNSSEYGNLPQNRERIYIIAVDKSIENALQEINVQKESLTTTIKNLLNAEKQENKYYYDNSKYYDMLSSSVTKQDTVYQLRRIYVRENKNNLCPTLTANMGTGGHNVPLILDDFGIRKLTPRECLRFQGFNDNFKIPNIADSHIYKQAGNSVSVPVIYKIAKQIRAILEY